VETKSVRVNIPEGANLIAGQTHFIKTVEDLYEIMATGVPQAAFGLAFNEASGPCLVRAEGNDEGLKAAAVEHALAIGAGHVFVLLLRDAYPINVLPQIKACVEVCTVFCATANPIEVIVAESELGRGVLGVIDGAAVKAAELPEDLTARRAFLRAIGYKL
jgi:hypothetical protein